MATSSKVQIQFDAVGCSIDSGGNKYTLRDNCGNEVTISLQAVLRCLSVAEGEKMVPALPGDFWQSVEHLKR